MYTPPNRVKFLFLALWVYAVARAEASVSVDYTCQFTREDITLGTPAPIDHVLRQMKKNDALNHWQDCTVGKEGGLTFTGNLPRHLNIEEADCKPKVFKVSFTPGAPIILSSNLNHNNTIYRRWNIDNNPRASALYTPQHDKSAVDLAPSRYTLMWVGTCDLVEFTLKPNW